MASSETQQPRSAKPEGKRKNSDTFNVLREKKVRIVSITYIMMVKGVREGKDNLGQQYPCHYPCL